MGREQGQRSGTAPAGLPARLPCAGTGKARVLLPFSSQSVILAKSLVRTVCRSAVPLGSRCTHFLLPPALPDRVTGSGFCPFTARFVMRSLCFLASSDRCWLPGTAGIRGCSSSSTRGCSSLPCSWRANPVPRRFPAASGCHRSPLPFAP